MRVKLYQWHCINNIIFLSDGISDRGLRDALDDSVF